MRTCREMAIPAIAVYAEPDARAPHALFADEKVALSGLTPRQAYLDIEQLVRVARERGGGIGMRVAKRPDDLPAAFEACRRAAQSSFGSPDVYLERYLEHPRHIEMQILADDHGTTVALGERECSIQRRHQKLLEETPAVGLSTSRRRAMAEAAVTAAAAVDYRNAGTIEFIVSGEEFYFLEMNTRLQVEHPVTESVLGVDLVREQIRIARGERIPEGGYPQPRGHAIA